MERPFRNRVAIFAIQVAATTIIAPLIALGVAAIWVAVRPPTAGARPFDKLRVNGEKRIPTG